uniref:antizyme inhibitor 2 isoform X9 n=1 Tax=Macaca mulatta TaxID=9544 RepID=UPI0010A28015|nr:antizyme inhibitor 2 isoform X9 [Macaca mulatta]
MGGAWLGLYKRAAGGRLGVGVGGCWAGRAQAAGPDPGGARERRRRGADSLAGETYGPKPCKCVLRGLGSATATPPRGVAQVPRSPATPPSSAPGSGPREGGRSLAEMELVQHIGVPASKIIYANPCKQIAQIKYAAKHGIQLLSFDNEMELAKVVKSHPSAKMVLCIATDDSHSLSRLSLKFGVSLKSCRHLLENAKKSHVEVVGVSFHIGSGCPDPQAYAQSIADVRLVFEMGTELGHKMHVLDLGGGFPGTEGAKVRFEEIASVINSALDLYFPEGCGVDILAELGRYYVTSAFTVAVSIIAKKEVLLDQPGKEEENGSTTKTVVYHLDEGVYGIFNSVLFDNICPTPILQKKPSTEQPLYSSSLWGPAVDGCDCVAEGLWLPQLHVGDWLVFDNMGAYTVGMGSPFGGTQACHITYAMSRVAWEALRRQLMAAEQEDDAEGVCKPLSCGWEITDTLCVGPVFTPASIM